MFIAKLSGRKLISELSAERKLSVRASNVCIRDKVCDVSGLLKVYSEQGDFLAMRGMGTRTNDELQRLCRELSLHDIDMPVTKSPNIIALEVYHELSADVQCAIQDFLEIILSKCSARTLNALRKLSGDFTFDAVARAFLEPQFRIENVRNVGVKTAAEMEHFSARVQELLLDLVSGKYFPEQRNE